MEFKALKNIESSFHQIRLFGLIFLVCCTLLTLLACESRTVLRKRNVRKSMFLDQGKSLMLALSQDLQQNRPVEAKKNTYGVFTNFFSLSPDKKCHRG